MIKSVLQKETTGTNITYRPSKSKFQIESYVWTLVQHVTFVAFLSPPVLSLQSGLRMRLVKVALRWSQRQVLLSESLVGVLSVR